jgi:hypothetical protein
MAGKDGDGVQVRSNFSMVTGDEFAQDACKFQEPRRRLLK